MITTIAIGLVVIASFCFAGGALFQHMAVSSDRVSEEQDSLSLAQILSLVRRPRWLLGLGLVMVGACLHLVALSQAPVTVVQPIGILAVPWSVLLAARIYRYRTTPVMWLTVAMTVIGIVGFTVLSTTHSDDRRSTIDLPLMLGAVVLCLAMALTLLLARRSIPMSIRSFAVASAGAILYGLASAATKTLFLHVEQADRFPIPVVVVGAVAILATYAFGGWVIQQAHIIGHPEVVVGSLTTVDPLIAVAYGLVVLSEGVSLTPLVVAGMIIFGAIATGGVAALSRYHPEARQRSLQPVGERA
ncbi:hypothetical protein [Naumannella halotolerans]|uniref:Magnesium transporter NIPA n=1 Tax=Naumannella halotolerans TaxID=993414 RepID=A0A4R7JBD6_9ACTN|nr:hypothetical protein [Naumannella halotolerans]TDT33923.1 hypothetical protein CLV29_1559 [Naumannella halotolerans]